MFNIVIADSSNKFHFKKTKNFIIGKSKISQFKLKGRNIEVLKQCEKYVKTKYVVYTGDDDFLCVDNLNFFLNYLDKNKKYAGTIGLTLLAKVIKEKLFFTYEYKIKEILSNNSINRVNLWFKHRSVLMFSICRSEIFFKSLLLIPSKEKRSICPHQNITSSALPNMAMAYYGRFKRVNIPYLVRVIGHLRTDASKKIDLKSVNYLFNCLTKLLGSDMNKKTKNFFYKKIHNIYIKKENYRKVKSSKFRLIKIFISSIFSILFLDKVIKKIYNKIFITKFSKEYIFDLKNKNSISFRNILNHLLTNHEHER